MIPTCSTHRRNHSIFPTTCYQPRHQLLDLLPELAVDRQVDEEVADVVDEVDVADVTGHCDVIKKQRCRYETDDLDAHNENKLNHSYAVTFAVL